MSDQPEGEGWWLASDGKWYPPPQPPPVSSAPPSGAYQPPTGTQPAAGGYPPPITQPGAQPPGSYVGTAGYRPPVAPKKPVTSKWWFWVLIGVAALILIGAIVGAVSGSNDKNKEAANSSSSSHTSASSSTAEESSSSESSSSSSKSGGPGAVSGAHAIGETAHTGDFDVTVNSVTDPLAPSDSFFTADPGNRFIAIDVTMANSSNEAKPVSSILSFELTDSEGRKYDLSIVGTSAAGTGTLDGDVPPQTQRRGTVAYEVPETITTGLQLRVKGDLTAGGTVFQIS